MELRKYSKNVTLFLARTLLDFLAVHTVREFIRPPREKHFMLLITKRFSKLVWTVKLKIITNAAVAKVFVTHSVFVYDPPVDLVYDSEPQCTSMVFQDVCRILDVRHMFVTTCGELNAFCMVLTGQMFLRIK